MLPREQSLGPWLIEIKQIRYLVRDVGYGVEFHIIMSFNKFQVKRVSLTGSRRLTDRSLMLLAR